VLKGFSFRVGEPGNVSELLMENAPVHFAENLNQMLAFLQARAPGPDGKPDAAKVKAFSDANPETLNQAHFVAARPLPGSFAGVNYWAVHSFPASNAKNETRFIKFKLVPLAGEIVLSDDEAKTKPAQFLVADLEQRINEGGVRFNLMALLDRPGDPTLNVTMRWPDEDERDAVRLGTITITGLDRNDECDQAIFNPANLASGIGQPKDEIFKARLTAYAISLSKRR
jgi:catalase